ncbi:hypothetical protein [Abyssalbus ytuae]|uniref:Outer membrane protein beta-barrel domain-containing protein n=1 Tax=Abyssalbus ytuae TaxID=2926907 RepID=A0A9E7CTR2_9FLAO|nr:hypothetical protein [Abyssalbus ytuae]UOB18506.1 hypothetical protein MQE35_04250 [Abyssalbus ytuae]
MIRIITFIAMWVAMLCTHLLNAQVPQDSVLPSDVYFKIKRLQEDKKNIIELEKDKLKEKVQEIHDLEDDSEITTEEAATRKQEAARETALNIENKTAIIDNRIELLRRGEDFELESFQDDTFAIKVGKSYYRDIDDFFEVVFNGKHRKMRYDRRTYSDIFFAVGLNNTIIEDQSLEDTPYQIGGSRFFELGWMWSSRVFKETNFLRIRYGFSFQFNGINPKDNMYFVDTGEETVLQEFPENLKKSKLRMDNLVFPVFFEMGPSKKIEKEDYFRYSTYNKFKFGLGGYAGFNISTRQKLKFKQNGEHIKQKLKGGYNTSSFIYGVAAYIGAGDTSLYLKYDLNPVFKDAAVKQNNISLGLRFDL